MSLCLVAAFLAGTNADAGTIIISRLSTSPTGTEGNSGSDSPSVSADGRYVAFNSTASNLAPGDGDATSDVFLKDTQTGAITLVSLSSLGVKGNNSSANPSISADGRYVAFWSYATNLSSSDQDFIADIFLRDTQTGFTTLVSTSTDGDAKGNSDSVYPSISADGRYVAFESGANNLVDVDNNNKTDIFVKDTQTHVTTRVSTATDGGQVFGHSHEPAISADGHHVAFWSLAQLVGADDPDVTPDVYSKNTQTGNVELVSVSSSEVKGNDDSLMPAISADGRYVAFESIATNLVADDDNVARDIFVRDTQTGVTTRVSTTSSGGQATERSGSPSISSDGRYVAFDSIANNLSNIDGNGNWDIFCKDTFTHSTDLVSMGHSGALSGGDSSHPAISADGRYVAFRSLGSHLVPGDGNAVADVFISHSGPRSAFTWYDNVYAANWILFANPSGVASDAWFDVSVAGTARTMPSLPGATARARYRPPARYQPATRG